MKAFFLPIFIFCYLSNGRFVMPQDVDITDVKQMDVLRVEKNKASNLSTARSGDKYVFDRALQFVLRDHDIETELNFIRNWGNPVPASSYGYWRDVSHIYKYFSGLNAEKLRQRGSLQRSDFSYLNRYEEASYPSESYHDSIIKLGGRQKLGEDVEKIDVLKGENVVGFIIKGTDLKLDFIFRGRYRIDYTQLNQMHSTIVVDFPLPMHTGGGKLIELAIEDGQVVNYLFSGGNRRSGVIIMDQEGGSYPMHIQHVEPRLWSDKNHHRYFDLAHKASDLKDFLNLVKADRLSMVMGMLLIDSLDGTSVREIAKSNEGGGR